MIDQYLSAEFLTELTPEAYQGGHLPPIYDTLSWGKLRAQMLSALIFSKLSYPAMPRAVQLADQRFVHPDPLVQWTSPLKYQRLRQIGTNLSYDGLTIFSIIANRSDYTFFPHSVCGKLTFYDCLDNQPSVPALAGNKSLRGLSILQAIDGIINGLIISENIR